MLRWQPVAEVAGATNSSETTQIVALPGATEATHREDGPDQGSSIMLTLCIAGVIWVVVLFALVVFRHRRKQKAAALNAPPTIGTIECSTNGTAIMTLHRFPVHMLPASERSNPVKRSSLPRLTSYDEPVDYHTVTFIESPGTDANSSMLTVTFHESMLQDEPSPPLLEELLQEDDDYRSDGEESTTAFYNMAGKESISSYATHGVGRSWAQSIQSADSQASSSDGH
ncbi:hypothetical protein ACHHYP_08425 [Achlya hypogyna]|uniref:Uncharacterized protein n=1 Tax=Achlya hypogyna TaxID=1202772 RepID=A0A1V9YPR6_ACHHY|nr:hypothetical protein ACHHYP_08425 [Achlya hypogyna]